MQLTVLCDNSVEPRPELIGEHGFACHIATGNKQYLFDTGSGLGLLHNARVCNIDLDALDAVLLSHGHWDHCGGLLPLLKLRHNRPLPVYAHPALFTQRISRSNETDRNVGPGFGRNEAEAAGACFYLSEEMVALSEGLLFSGQIPRLVDPTPENNFLYVHDGTFSPDTLPDDQSLYLQTANGLTILCGCAHAGVRNILQHALNETGAKSLYGLIGGLHLMRDRAEQENLIIEDLQQHDIQLLALSHCTGTRATSHLMGVFNERAIQAAVGFSLQI